MTAEDNLCTSNGEVRNITKVETALFDAWSGCSTNIVIKLLAAEANTNILCSNAMTRLYIAAKKGFQDIVTQLLPKSELNS